MPAASTDRPPLVERVDGTGIMLSGTAEAILDVAFDDRRVWSFWWVRDSEEDESGSRLVRWPTALKRHLEGHTRLRIGVHGAAEALFEDEIGFGCGTGRIAVVDAQGQPLGIDKSGKLMPTFENRTPDQVAPLLDSTEAVLAALAEAGVAAFPAYGTLLGAVRDGALIGHDSDADLGYVSRHDHPADVVRESFALQRRLTEAGFTTSRYSGASFKVEVVEADGYVRGLDVFGGFLGDGKLWLMGEIRTPYRKEWIFPPSTCVLEGRTLPAPADPERMLEAMYGPAWRVPDPAFKFATPPETVRALNEFFRVARARRDGWARWYGGQREPASPGPSALAELVAAEEGVPGLVYDVGAGPAQDALWFARQGGRATAYDFLPRVAGAAVREARAAGLDLDVRLLNLQEWRSVLAEGARVARIPGEKVVLAHHVLDSTPRFGRESLVRFATMALRAGGRLYADFWTGGGPPSRRPQSPVAVAEVVDLLERAGAHILQSEDTVRTDDDGRRTGQVVAQWA